MQMNTLQRRVTALKQALINLTTSTNGGVSNALKGLVNVLVSLIQHLNNIPVQQLGFTILMNVIVLKGPAIINILNRMKNSVLGVGQAFNSLGKMGKANVFVAVATVIYDACSALGMFDTATTKAGKELDKLNQKIEVQTELGFRPLAGIMVLIATTYLKKSGTIASCFRPLAGIMVLIEGLPDAEARRPFPFPSPCGDYGSYRHVLKSAREKAGFVSVPLRGLWFLSLTTMTETMTSTKQFPSPCGDYGSYLRRR